jgi:hypothetical protein
MKTVFNGPMLSPSHLTVTTPPQSREARRHHWGQLRHVPPGRGQTPIRRPTRSTRPSCSVALLRDMINWCIENPVKGQPLSPDEPRLRALEAYIISQRNGAALAYGKH